MAELIHLRGSWRSVEAADYATLEWVDVFNHRRLPEPMSDTPPAEAETPYYVSRVGAGSRKPNSLWQIQCGSASPGGQLACIRLLAET